MNSTRRSFIASSSFVARSAFSRAAGGARSVHLGGPIFLKSEDPAELAREHRKLGYSAAYCPDVKNGDAAHIRAMESAFKEQNVLIAEVGAWKNILDPDATKRRQNLTYVTERCALADEVGALCCVDIAGSYNPDVWYGPNPKNLSKEFFDATVENCRHIIDTVKPRRTKFTVEMMGWNLPDGPDSYVELIKSVDRKAFGVHLDVCNVINNPRRFYENAKFIDECFAKLGPHVISCHAKDLQWVVELNLHFLEVIPGRGQVSYANYLRGLASLGHDAPLMLEHLKTAEEYNEGKEYIRRVGREIGIQFA
jgi:sugar phosphate isomerase/epimerase